MVRCWLLPVPRFQRACVEWRLVSVCWRRLRSAREGTLACATDGEEDSRSASARTSTTRRHTQAASATRVSLRRRSLCRHEGPPQEEQQPPLPYNHRGRQTPTTSAQKRRSDRRRRHQHTWGARNQGALHINKCKAAQHTMRGHVLMSWAWISPMRYSRPIETE